MKKVLAALVIACAATSANASMIYNDPAGDVFTGAGGGILDILSMEVTNDASVMTLKLTLAADIGATDWGKYMVIFDTAPGGDTVGNGWGRPISMTSGADYWLGTWVDSGNGIQKFDYTGAWNMTAANGPFAGPGGTPASDPAVGISKSGNMLTLTVSLASMGLVAGQVIQLDAFTSGGGGGDGAVDSLGNPNQQISDWGNASNAHPVSYTVKVPEPTTLGLLAFGSLALLRRKR